MDKRDIAAQAERYRQELMRLYGRSTAVPAVNTRIETEKLPKAPPEAEREIITEPEVSYEPEQPDVRNQQGAEPVQQTAAMPQLPQAQEEQSVSEPEPAMPEPEASAMEEAPQEIVSLPAEQERDDHNEDFMRLQQRLEMIGREAGEEEIPEYPSEDSIGTAKGYILVNVRTGDDSEPIENASVQVVAIVDGNRMILASGVTDRSGISPKFEVPAPDISYSQAPDPAVRPYSLFDITVTAEGFFNARSVDVPVFEGITSVQNFSMIPVPLFMRPGEETVTTYNQNTNLG